jgi:hypothetical protein
LKKRLTKLDDNVIYSFALFIMAWKSYHSKNLKEKYLLKFLSGENLINFLNSGSIWFSRSDIFGDKMECVRIIDLKQVKPDFEKIESRKKRFLISCWHLADKETLALWDTYTDTIEKRRTFAIRFKKIELVQLVNDNFFPNNSFYYLTEFVHGKILYKDLINIKRELLNNKVIKYPAFRKESVFKYENEYRFAIRMQQPFLNDGFSYNLGIPNKLPFEILINPLLKKEEHAELKSQIEQMGFGKNLKQSDLAKWLQPEFW